MCPFIAFTLDWYCLWCVLMMLLSFFAVVKCILIASPGFVKVSVSKCVSAVHFPLPPPPPAALFFFLSQDLRVFHLIKITFWQKQHIGGPDSGQFEYEKASSFKQMLGNFSMRRPVPLNRSWIKYEKASPFKQMLGNLTMGRPVPLNRCWAI